MPVSPCIAWRASAAGVVASWVATVIASARPLVAFNVDVDVDVAPLSAPFDAGVEDEQAESRERTNTPFARASC